MLTRKKKIASFLALTLFAGFTGYGVRAETEEDADSNGSVKAYIEETLNLANNTNQEWTYSANANAWVLSVVSAVAYPELPDQQGVSVCVPGAYVAGIDTNGDGNANIRESRIKDVKVRHTKFHLNDPGEIDEVDLGLKRRSPAVGKTHNA